MREQHNGIVQQLKHQLAVQPSECKSVKKVWIDKAEKLIDELQDKVDECEEEMVRIRKNNENEIMKLKEMFGKN